MDSTFPSLFEMAELRKRMREQEEVTKNLPASQAQDEIDRYLKSIPWKSNQGAHTYCKSSDVICFRYVCAEARAFFFPARTPLKSWRCL